MYEYSKFKWNCADILFKREKAERKLYSWHPVDRAIPAKMASQQQQPPGGPMPQPGLQQPATIQQQLSQQQDFDPVHRFKMLIPQLKESLQVIVTFTPS